MATSVPTKLPFLFVLALLAAAWQVACSAKIDDYVTTGGDDAAGSSTVSLGGDNSIGGQVNGSGTAAADAVSGGLGAGGQSDSAAALGGTSTTGGTSEPTQCSNSDALQVASLATGNGHTCALMSNGGVGPLRSPYSTAHRGSS